MKLIKTIANCVIKRNYTQGGGHSLVASALCAILALAATSAQAAEYTITGAMNGNTDIHNAVGNVVTFNGVTGFLKEVWLDGTYQSDMILVDTEDGTAAFNWTDGASAENHTVTFSGKLMGAGTFTDISSSYNQSFIFSGNLSEFTGSFIGSGTKTHNLNLGNGEAAVLSEGKTSATGTGPIDWNVSTLTFNYNNTADVVLGNSSIAAKSIVFAGGANYTVNAPVTGKGTSPTLAVNRGTTKICNSLSGFTGGVSVASGATMVIGSTGKLNLSSATTLEGNFTTEAGATLNLGGASADNAGLTINGTATINSGTIFDFSSLTPGSDLNIKLVSASGLDAAGMSIANIKIGGLLANQRRGTAVFAVEENVLVLKSYTAGENIQLTWNGGVVEGEGDDELHIWKEGGTGWLDSDGNEATFQHGDSVSFGSDYENKTVLIDGVIKAGTVSVAGEWTFNGEDVSVATTAADVSIAEGGKLTLSSGVTLDLTSSGAHNSFTNNKIAGTGTVKLATKTGDHTNLTISMSQFNGTVKVSGNVNAGLVTLGNEATLVPSGSGSIWGANGSTLATKVRFESNYTINCGNNLNFKGGIIAVDGTTVTITGNSRITLGDATNSTDYRFWNLLSSNNTGEIVVSQYATLTVAGTYTKNGASKVTTFYNYNGTEGTSTVRFGEIDVAAGTMKFCRHTSQNAYYAHYLVEGRLSVRGGGAVTIDTQAFVEANRILVNDRAAVNSSSWLTINDNGIIHVTGENKSATSSSILIGHWGGSGEKKLTVNNGGTLTAEKAQVLIGWDSGASFELSGVANVLGIDLNSAKTGISTFTLTATGRANLGANGVVRPTPNYDYVKINGGTFGAMNNWTSVASMCLNGAMTVDTSKVTVNDDKKAEYSTTEGYTITLNGLLYNATDTGTTIGSLNKNGNGTLTLGGANTYTGGTTVNAGTLKVTHASAVSSGDVTINNGATLDVCYAAANATAIKLTSGTFTLNDGASIAINGTTVTILAELGGDGDGWKPVQKDDGWYLVHNEPVASYGGNNYYTFSSAIDAAVAAGGTYADVVVLNPNATLPPGYAIITTAGESETTYSLRGGSTVYGIAGTITFTTGTSVAMVANGAATTTLIAGDRLVITSSANTVTIDPEAAIGGVEINLANSTDVLTVNNYNGSNGYSFDGGESGQQEVSIVNGVLYLNQNGNNSYNAKVRNVLFNIGENGGLQNYGWITVTGQMVIKSDTNHSVLENPNYPDTASRIQGGGTVVKRGSGKITLASGLDGSTALDVQAGTIVFTERVGSAFGTGTTTVASGATLEFAVAENATVTVGNKITSSGTIKKTGPGTAILSKSSRDDVSSTKTTVEEGDLVRQYAGNTNTVGGHNLGHISVSEGATLEIAIDGDNAKNAWGLDFGEDIDGTLKLTSTSTKDFVCANGAVLADAKVVLGENASLMNYQTLTLKNVSIGGEGTLKLGGENSGKIVFQGNNSLEANLSWDTKKDNGTFEIQSGTTTFNPATTADTFTNTTTVNDGAKLVIAKVGAIGGGSVVVESGATLNSTIAAGAGQKFVGGGAFTINGTVTHNGNEVAYVIKNDGLYLPEIDVGNPVILIGDDMYVPSGTTFENYTIKVADAETPSTLYTLSTDYVVAVRNETRGKVEIGLLNASAPTVSDMAMPNNGTSDTIKFTISNPIKGLYYAVVSAAAIEDLDTAIPTTGMQATDTTVDGNGKLPVSVGMPEDATVQFYKIRTQLWANPTVTP